MNNMNGYEYEYEDTISLKDMLACILDKWVAVLVCLVIGALIGSGLYVIASGSTDRKEVTEESIEAAREALNIEQIEQVDYLYAQYKSYKEYRKLMQTYMADSLFSEVDQAITCTAMYYVESDIHNVNSVFTNLAVGKAEMEKIASILGKEQQNLDDVYRRVVIENSYSDFLDGAGLSYEMSGETDEAPNKNILRVSIVADTQEQADAMIAVIDEALQKEADTLRSMDEGLVLNLIGKQYSSNITSYLQSQRTAVINNLNDATNQINSLQNNYIDKLSSDEKAYFEALKSYDEQELEVIKKPSLKKYVVIGAAAGLLIVLIILIIRYIFSHSVKTVEDVSGKSRIEVPYVIYRKKSGFHLFGGWSRRLKGADLSDIAVSQELVSSDLTIKLHQQEAKSAYIACDSQGTWSREILQSLQKQLHEQNADLQLTMGNPLASTDDLHAFAKADAVILAVQLKTTSSIAMEKWIQLCNRYERSIVGAVVLEEC